MSTAVDTGWELSPAEIGVLADVVGSDTLVDVLGIVPASRADRRAARTALTARGLLDQTHTLEATDLGLVSALRSFAAPTVALTARCAATGLVAVLATDDGESALAVRTPGAVVLRRVWAPDSRASARVLGGVLDSAVGATTPAAVPSARFPLDALADRLRTCHDSHDVAAAFAGGGLPPQDASLLAAAVTTARRRTEIVARVRVDGLPTTSVGAVAVLDGPAGRVIAGPDLSVDGTPWTTFSPGTALRLEQALGRLVATVPGADVPPGTTPGHVA